MPNDQNQPGEYDAVKGGQNSTPVDAAVLGGIAGVKSRLASPAVEARITALSEALKYGDAGLDLISGALRDESMQVKFTAYSLLKDRKDLKIKLQFQDYLPTFEFDVITVDSHGRENSRTKSFARFFPKVDSHGRENSRTKSLAHFFPQDLGNGIVLEMVYIPGGTFMMGSPAKESGRRDNESPQHQITVPAFFAGKYPITQAQWQAVMGNNPSQFRGEKRPVENVLWDMAVEFCGKLSEKTGTKYRLLSEAEWEYACRAGTTTPFHFGETITPDLVNYDGSLRYANAPKGIGRRQTTDVGSFPPNAFGLYDMHGNVWEWCSDNWHDSYNGAPTDGSSWQTATDYRRVLRGGSWRDGAIYCRSAFRVSNSAIIWGWGRGFRVAVASVSSSS